MTEEKKPAANPMGTKPVMRLLLTMAIPPMISMFTTSMYNIVDSMYVSAMGEKALTAVSLVFPLQNIILSVAVGVGVGMNSIISRAVGAGRGEEADEVASQAMLAVLLHFVGFVLIGLFLAKPYLAMYTKRCRDSRHEHHLRTDRYVCLLRHTDLPRSGKDLPGGGHYVRAHGCQLVGRW